MFSTNSVFKFCVVACRAVQCVQFNSWNKNYSVILMVYKTSPKIKRSCLYIFFTAILDDHACTLPRVNTFTRSSWYCTKKSSKLTFGNWEQLFSSTLTLSYYVLILVVLFWPRRFHFHLLLILLTLQITFIWLRNFQK